MSEGSLTEYGLPWSEIHAERTLGFGKPATLTVCLTLHPAAAARELARLINLEPLGVRGIERLAVAVAGGHVSGNWAHMVRGPLEVGVSGGHA